MIRVLSIAATVAFVATLAVFELDAGDSPIGIAVLIAAVLLGLGLALRRTFLRFRDVLAQVRAGAPRSRA